MNYRTDRKKLNTEIRNNPDVKRYLDSIPHSSLSTEVVADLIARKCAGDHDARQALIIANMLLVVSVASNYIGYGLPTMDLFMAGNEGLIKAIDKLQPGQSLKIVAGNWIRAEIQLAVANTTKDIRLPRKIQHIKRAVTKAEARLGDDAADEVIAKEIGATTNAVHLARQLRYTFVSLDGPIHYDRAIIDNLMSEDFADMPTITAERDEVLHDAIEDLEPLARAIITMRYDILNTESRDYTDREAARALGLKLTDLHVIEARALGEIKAALMVNGYTSA